jgi:hypothetical protein
LLRRPRSIESPGRWARDSDAPGVGELAVNGRAS